MYMFMSDKFFRNLRRRIIAHCENMDCDDIIRDWNDDANIKEEQLSEDEHSNDYRTHDETGNSELIQETFSNEGCCYFIEENKCKLDFKEEDQDESHEISSLDQSTNYSNFDAVISKPTENEVMVSMDQIVASEIYIDENDDIGNEPTIENKKKRFSRFSHRQDLFSYTTEDTECTGPESGVPKSSDVAELANRSTSQLCVHAEDQKRKLEKILKCGICGSKFRRKYNFKKHMSSHNRRTTQLRCKVCLVGFDHKYNLKTHMIIHGHDGGKIISTQDNSFVDTSVHSAERPFVCIVCHKSFKFKAVLKTHMNVHSEERPFFCCMCDRSFKFKSVLRTHIMTVHKNEKKEKLEKLASYECKSCSQSFARKAQFQKHVRAHAYEQYKFSLLPVNRA